MKTYDYIMTNATHSPAGEFEELRLSFCDGGELVSITARPRLMMRISIQ